MQIASEKLRSDSNASNNSLNNSFDQSPLSPPPSINGVPLYNPNLPPIEKEQVNGEEDRPLDCSGETTNDNGETTEIETPDTGRAPLPSYDEMVLRNSAEVSHDTESSKEETLPNAQLETVATDT